MSDEPQEIWFVAPGRFPGKRGTPLSIEWTARAWQEGGGRCVIWTSRSSDVAHTALRVRRSGIASSEHPGPSASRLYNTLSVARSIRKALRSALHPLVLHAHGADGALAAHLATANRFARRPLAPWIGQAHTRLEDEFCAYVPGPIGRHVGALLDRAVATAPAVAAYRRSDSLHPRKTTVVPPIVPTEECQALLSLRADPSKDPSAVYLGNPDRYQALSILKKKASQLRIDVVSHHGPGNRLWRELRGHLTWHQVESVSDALKLAATAWWGLVPRRLYTGYPFKAVNYTGLGLPTLAFHDWGLPAHWQLWNQPLDLSAPPERLPIERLLNTSRASIEVLASLYRSATQAYLED